MLTLTINATSIPDMATQLADLHQKFNGIAQLMATPVNQAADTVTHALADTPLEKAIEQQRAGDTTPAPAAEAPVKTGRGKKPAAPKEAKPPKDTFFEEEKAAEAPAETKVEDTAVDGEGAYTDEMPDEACYTTLRARAKQMFDEKGQDTLFAFWTDHWAAIIPEATGKPPGIKHLEGNRPAILRALAVFDAYHGIDPVTGEAAASDPAADLL